MGLSKKGVDKTSSFSHYAHEPKLRRLVKHFYQWHWQHQITSFIQEPKIHISKIWRGQMASICKCSVCVLTHRAMWSVDRSHFRMTSHLSWWRHQMETFSALLAICAGNSPVPGEFPAQRPMTRSFGVFFDLRLNKRLSKHSYGWWFETLSCPLWRHCNVVLVNYLNYWCLMYMERFILSTSPAIWKMSLTMYIGYQKPQDTSIILFKVEIFILLPWVIFMTITFFAMAKR